MSGGSFRYLCHAVGDAGLLGDQIGDIADMAAALEALDDGKAAARATREVLRLLHGAGLASMPLAEVWRAVEWRHSNDYSDAQMHEAIAAFNAEHGQPGDVELSRQAMTDQEGR